MSWVPALFKAKIPTEQNTHELMLSSRIKSMIPTIGTDENVGPGNYHLKSQFDVQIKQQKQSSPLRAIELEIMKASKVGPGDYIPSPQKTKVVTQLYRYTRENSQYKHNFGLNEECGSKAEVGRYEIKSSIGAGPTHKLSKSPRFNQKKDGYADFRGPGAHNLRKIADWYDI
ncbi:Hypothetical_protein [Hexamita inflata]|uniref:Hypothetical_protein n=1 Tax=Hexamita inflata TaxID=28002 RepID=A0AA86PQF0_9EUKA|nr:Hypothetical protein HINF_LOCUS31431 [Hexamita inflata]